MSKLKNGATIIDTNGQVVLANWQGHGRPFVTWRLDQQGNTFLGHYYASLIEAVVDFQERAAKYN